MIKNSWLSLALVALALFCASCGSIRKRALHLYLKRFQDQKAKSVKLSPPASPYEKQSHPVLDALWWNPLSKSSISYFSRLFRGAKKLRRFSKRGFSPKPKL